MKIALSGRSEPASQFRECLERGGFQLQTQSWGCDLVLSFKPKLPRLGKSPKILCLDSFESLDHGESRHHSERIIRSVQRASGVVLPSKYSLERFNFHFPSFPEDSILVHSPPRNEVRPLEQNEYAKILCELGINRPFFFHLPGNEHDPSIPVSIQAFQSSQAPIAGMQFVLPQEVSQANRIPGLLCLPKLSPNQIHALHSAAEAVIAPKQGAHNPSQLIEALQCGACGVAMDSGAYPETLQGAWPLGDSKDSHSFARILDRQLIDPHFRREICAASLRRSSEILREDSGERLYDFLNGFLE